MANYTVVEKDSFIVAGLGTELKSAYTDYAGISKEKSDFWQNVSRDGRLEHLKSIASNNYIFAVNEAVNGKMMFYAGVMTSAAAPEEARLIQFPKGEYLVVEGTAATSEELANNLAGVAFGQALPEAGHLAYVGGPNTTVELERRGGQIIGEMWIPVIRK
ncbi:GyrI-like domain-containing protein [Paenibacillus sp. MMS20-IR301]|uniref:GyrI-like domain-containing protein n=1 Tax=Paenibacillus sp. MMS20-IR301 TaxID=2895946 RepID=UPI0028F11FEE|nr:GyrI-like domain-containing protein [Paenibacillus sp. MMS20-IR301]WNS45233.1 GyrI-like domain-containing protein [Paenibacillus sp. MMS20-IR301]